MVWGILYYSYNKEPPKSYSNYSGPYIRRISRRMVILLVNLKAFDRFMSGRHASLGPMHSGHPKVARVAQLLLIADEEGS